MVERRLAQTVARLSTLREQLAQVDEQYAVVTDEASDLELRALVSETPLSIRDAAESRKHADAMARSRARLVESIEELERRQDELLDELSGVR